MSRTSQLDCLGGEQKRDVMFVIDGQSIPALKSFLAEKSRVFSAMFSGNSKEAKDNVIVIEDTTYEAFNTFIGFLNNDHLILDIDNEFELIQELYSLSDRYEVSYFEDRITDELTNRNLLKAPKCESEEEFQKKWPTIRSLIRIAFISKISRLIENVLTFIDINFDHFLKKEDKEMHELNDLTDGRLFDSMVNKFRKLCEEINGLKESMEWVKHSNSSYFDDNQYSYQGGLGRLAILMEM